MKGGLLKPIVEINEAPQPDSEVVSRDGDGDTTDSTSDRSSNTHDTEEEDADSEPELPTDSILVNVGSEETEDVLTEGDQPLDPNEVTSDQPQPSNLPRMNYKKWHVNKVHSAASEYLTINVTINGIEIRSLLDTGASMSLITESTARQLNLDINVHERNCIYGIGGKEMTTKTLGTVTTPLQIYKLKFPSAKFHVVSDTCIDEQIFIGYEFLKTYGLTVNIFRKCIKYVDKRSKSQWDLYVFPGNYKLVLHRLVCRAACNKTFDPVKEDYVQVPIIVDYPEYVCPEGLYGPDDLYLYEGLTGDEEDDNLKQLNRLVQGVAGFVNLTDPNIYVSSTESGKKAVKFGDVMGRVSTVVVLDYDTEERMVNVVTSTTENSKEPEKTTLNLGTHLTIEQKQEVYNLLEKQQEVISTGDDLGHIKEGSLKIKLYDYTPIYHKPRRFPDPIMNEVEEQIKELEAKDIIEPSKSPFNCRILPIRKPDGTLRLCMDYRELNKNTVPDRFPMTNLTDSIYSLYGSKYFTTLDLVRGYYQLSVDPDSREFTAFSTSRGHWQYKRMPFGLRNAPAAFQRTMQTILRDFSRSKVIVYLDDILIISKDFEEHKTLVRQVLKTLIAHGIKIKPEKCAWFQHQVEFLGHNISETGITKHPKYIDKVKNFPRPENIKELRQFMGLVNWQRKFIERCAEIGKPLFALTGGRRTSKINWNETMIKAFEDLKTELIKDIKLAFPDYSEVASPLELFVDASATGVGVCLTQRQNGELRVILYDSHAFTDTQRTYSTIERELAAIRWGVKTFRAFLFGQEFILHTDHQPLVYLHNMKFIDNRLARTLEDLAEFNFTIQYTPGRTNEAADAMSRVHRYTTEEHPPVNSKSLPLGLEVEDPVSGGGDSLVISLHKVFKNYQKEYKCRDIVFPETPDSLRKLLVSDLLQHPEKFSLPTENKFKKQLKSMLSPGVLPVPEIITAFAERYKLTVCVHYGYSTPVIYQGLTITNKAWVHLQCLAGIHYNPVYESKLTVDLVRDEINDWCSDVANRCSLLNEVNIVNSIEPDIEESSCEVNVIHSIKPPDCNHRFDGAIITTNIENITCCTMLDSGALVNLMSEDLFHKLNNKNLDTTPGDIILGIGDSNSEILGITEQLVTLGNDDNEPYNVQFLVVPYKSLDTCIILGLPILHTVDLDMNFKYDKVYKNNKELSEMGRKIYAKTVCAEDIMNTRSLYFVPIYQIALHSFPGLTPDKLLRCQDDDRLITRLKTLITGEVPFNKIPRRFQKYKRHWSSLSIKDQILVKEINGQSMPILPFQLVVDIVLNTHVQNAHIGAYKLFELLQPHFWHPSLRSIVKDACFSCGTCQRCKPTAKVRIPPTIKINTSQPFELMAVDLVSLPTTSDGYVGILVLVDHYSKWLAVAPIRNKRATHIVDKLESQLFPSLIKLPVRLLSDNGPEFNSLEFQYMTEKLNIHHIKTTAYKPSSNGAVERVNRTIVEFLRSLVSPSAQVSKPAQWKIYLPNAVRIYNSTTHRETGISPSNFIMTREHPHKDLPIITEHTRKFWNEGHPEYISFKKGQLVLRRINRPGKLNIHKLQYKYSGPYQVIKVHANDVTYIIKDEFTGQTHKVHHSQLKPWRRAPKYIVDHLKLFPMRPKLLDGQLENMNEEYYNKPNEFYLIPEPGTTSVSVPDEPLTVTPLIDEIVPNFNHDPVSVEELPDYCFANPSAEPVNLYPALSSSSISSSFHSSSFHTLSPPLSPCSSLPTHSSEHSVSSPVVTAPEPFFYDSFSEEDYSDDNCLPDRLSTINEEINELLSELSVSSPIASDSAQVDEAPICLDPLIAIPNFSSSGRVLERNFLDWELSSIDGDRSSLPESLPEVSCTQCSEVLSLVAELSRLCLSQSNSLSEPPESDPLGIASLWKTDSSSSSEPSLSFVINETFLSVDHSSSSSHFSGFSNQEIFNTERTSRRLQLTEFISELSQGLSEIRGVILQNRRNSLERVREAIREHSNQITGHNKRSYSVSPPHLRSRGRAQDIPNVMTHLPERQSKKRKLV